MKAGLSQSFQIWTRRSSPPNNDDFADPPYPGVVALYTILLRDSDRLTYVTARSPERVVDVPAWLDVHGLPTGPIETGISGIPAIARREKVNDISRTFNVNPDRAHVLFGDSSHVDPEAYKDILELFPQQFRIGLIHKVTASIPDDRIDGLKLFHNHVEAAVILAGETILSTDEARLVFDAAVDEGLAMTETEFDALLQIHGL